MSKDQQPEPRPLLTKANEVLGSVGGAIAAILFAREFVPASMPGGSMPWALALGCVVGAGIYFVWRYVVRPREYSSVANGDLFDLRVDTQEQLRGRATEVDVLVRHCKATRLVFLVGASGAGKSTLARMGLIPAVNTDPSLLGVYCSLWAIALGQDLRVEIAGSLEEVVREKLVDRFATLGEITATRLGTVVRQLQKSHGRRVVLVLDQFDDYLLKHRDALFRTETRTWISSTEFLGTDDFWHELHRLVNADVLTVLVVTRQDFQDGLEMIRFMHPSVVRLDPFRQGTVREILEGMAKPVGERQAVASPEKSWTALSGRVAADLEEEGPVLPIRLKVIIQGLRALPALSVIAYERGGGLRGLERGFLNHHISVVAAHAGVHKATVASLLAFFVESTGASPTSRTLRAEEIEARAPELRVEVAQLKSCVDELVTRQVLRARVGVQGLEHLLFHDHYASIVVESQRAAGNVEGLLRDRAQRFAAVPASSVLKRYRSLLTLADLVRVARARVRGQLHLGKYRSFFLRSLGVHAAILAVLLLLWFGAADAGAPVPLRRSIQRGTDHLGASLLRPVPSFQKVHARAKRLASDTVKDLLNRRRPDATFKGESEVEPESEPWSNSQCLAAILSVELEAADLAKVDDSIRGHFKLFGINDATGRLYGWIRYEHRETTVGPPAMWTAWALACRLRHSQAMAGWSQLWSTNALALQHLYSEETGGWNEFPRQKGRAANSAYATTMALLVASEVCRNTEPGDVRDEWRRVGRACAQWLLKYYRADSALPGWTHRPSAGTEVHDGLTLHAYAALMLAKEAGIVDDLPEGMVDRIDHHLSGITGRSVAHPTTTGEWLEPYLDHLDKTAAVEHTVTFLWIPWACAATASRLSMPDVSSADRRQLLRVMDHVLTLLETQMADRKKLLTFEEAEMAIGLAIAAERLGKQR